MLISNKKVQDFEVEISEKLDIDTLKKEWLSIEKEQDLPFFLTWAWISCWLETYQPELIVVSAKVNDKVVAIGLFTCSTQVRHGVVKSIQYRLHQMGDPLLDQIWMEFNDFVCIEEYRVEAVNACLKTLLLSDLKYNEIILSMMTESRADQICSDIDNAYRQMVNASFSSDFESFSADTLDYLSTLTSNTRYQINRSKRLYESLHGEIRYEIAQDVEQALAYLEEAGKFHVLRWEDSGFKNPQFVAFHEKLISDTFDSNSIDIMKITSGDVTIAILYFHIVNSDVYFYLQGVNYESDKKLKPGLLAHSIATQYYLDKGMRKYDYMGGYSQYKCQLSSPSEDMVTLCIQRPSIAFSLEKSGRVIKNLITR